MTARIDGKGERKLVAITVDTDGARGNATGTFTATENHPVWLAKLDRWVHAGDLSSGNWLRTAAGTPASKLEEVLKGIAVDCMRRNGQLGPNDSVNGHAWKRPRVEACR